MGGGAGGLHQPCCSKTLVVSFPKKRNRIFGIEKATLAPKRGTRCSPNHPIPSHYPNLRYSNRICSTRFFCPNRSVSRLIPKEKTGEISRNMPQARRKDTRFTLHYLLGLKKGDSSLPAQPPKSVTRSTLAGMIRGNPNGSVSRPPLIGVFPDKEG